MEILEMLGVGNLDHKRVKEGIVRYNSQRKPVLHKMTLDEFS
jgi:hypothetical protein